MQQWLPTISAWVATLITGLIALYQLFRSYYREINKELNQQRLEFYPEVQNFMSSIYGRTWSEAMKDEGRLDAMMLLSNKFILWGSNRTLKVWIGIVDAGQRKRIDEIGALAKYWAELDIQMRRDLGYGVAFKSKDLFPILFSPRTVDKIKQQLKVK